MRDPHHDHVDHEDEPYDQGPSKSQRKRDKHALHVLAERMARMPAAELEELKLSTATRAALEETHRIKDIRALGRHWKHIANLLEREDMDAVHALVDRAEERESRAAAHHHLVERWRERLIEEDAGALSEFIAAHPHVDRQQLRALIRAAQRDHEHAKPDAPRKLYRFIRDALADHG